MDIFNKKLEEFLKVKDTVVKEYLDENRKERKEMMDMIEDTKMSYDMNKFLKTVRDFEAERAKKGRKKKSELDI